MNRAWAIVGAGVASVMLVVAQPRVAHAEARRDYKAELSELLVSGLSKEQQAQSVAASEELLAIDDEIKRIDQGVMVQVDGANAAQADENAQIFIDVSLLLDTNGRYATPIMWAAADEAMRRYEALGVLARLRSLASVPRLSRFNTVESLLRGDVDGVLKLSRATRSAAQILAAIVMQRAVQGDRDGAIDEIMVLYELGDLLARSKTGWISALTGLSTSALGNSVARQLLRDGLLDADSMVRLGKMIDERDWTHDHMSSIDVKILSTLVWCDQVIEASPGLMRSVWRAQAEDATRFYRDEFVRVAGLPRSERMRAELDPEVMLKGYRRLFSPIDSLILNMFDFNRILRIKYTTMSDSGGVRIMLAVEAFRASRGALPATIEELVPEFIAELPLDPFAPDGRYRYIVHPAVESLPAAYTLYSVGFDGVDDGGAWPDVDESFNRRHQGSNGHCQQCDYIINAQD